MLRQVATTASGVFANFGGVPLAFLFIATLGTSGLATKWLKDLGFDPYTTASACTPSSAWLVYMYFQIPLMVLVIMPALEGLRPGLAGGRLEMGARTLAVLAATWAARCCSRRSSAACCCCSAARCPPTPRPRP